MTRKPFSMRAVGWAALIACASAGADAPSTLPSTAPATLPTTAPAATTLSPPPTLPATRPATNPTTAPATAPTTAPATGPTTGPATLPVPLSAAEKAEIDALIESLSGSDWRTRDAAQRKLVEKGERVKPALDDLVSRTTDAEVRNRAQDALGQIAEGDRTGETRVTLQMADVPPQEVIAELSRQARAPIEVWPPTMWRFRPRGPVTLDIDRKPFFEALQIVCEKLKLRPQAIGNERGFTLMDNGGAPNPFQGPCLLSGPFMFTASGVNEAKGITFDQAGAGDPRHTMDLALTLYAEPKLRVLGRAYRADVQEVTDESGRSLLPTVKQVGQPTGMDPNTQNNMMSITIPLKPGTGAKRIAKLRGVQKLVLQTKTESAEFGDAMNAKGQTRDLAGNRFTLKDVKKQGPGNVSVNIACAPIGNAGPAGLFRLAGRARQAPVVSADLRVLDADGTVLMRSRLQFFNGQGESGISSGFGGNGGPPPGDPAKVIIEVATETRELEVPFEFTDLPLP